MSNFTQAAALMMIGGLAGAGGLAFIANETQPEAATPKQAVHTMTPSESIDEVPAEAAPEPDVLTVTYGTTGSVESDSPSSAYALFKVVASEDVADVTLTVVGVEGATVEEALGHPWAISGSSVNVELGEMGAMEEKTVVVALKLRTASARFKTHTSFRDLHTGEVEKVLGASRGHSISRKMQEPDVYHRVRVAYSEDAMTRAEALADEKDYEEALAWVEDAYGRNVEVGMTLRIGGELSGLQADLSSMRDELKLLSKPKHRVKPRKPKAPGIVWTFGDRASPSDK